MIKPFKMALPKNLDGAITTSGADGAQLLAGGTDLLAELKERIEPPDVVVNLKTVPGLHEIKRTSRGLEIGALVTLTEVIDSPEVAKDYPALIETLRKTATPHIRNVGTMGGNLCQRPRCWYYRNPTYLCLKKGGDKCYALQGENEFHSIFDNSTCAAVHPSNAAPVLMAHDAKIDIAGPDGTRTIDLEYFFVAPRRDVTRENILEPGEIVTAIVLPAGSEKRRCAYVETREKQSFDWAICGSTVGLRLDGDRVTEARVVLSAVAPTPQRRKDLEGLLQGRTINDKVIEQVVGAATREATPLAQNGYKVALLRVTLKRALQQAMKG